MARVSALFYAELIIITVTLKREREVLSFFALCARSSGLWFGWFYAGFQGVLDIVKLRDYNGR